MRGQILPLAIVPVLILTTLIGLFGEVLVTGVEKIRLQRASDSLAMIGAVDQARALNAIAALNEGLILLRRRATLFQSTQAALALCAVAVGGPCAQAAAQAVIEAPRFYRGVTRAANHLARQQDLLQSHAHDAARALVETFNGNAAPQGLRAHSYSNDVRLRRDISSVASMLPPPLVLNGPLPRITLAVQSLPRRSVFAPFLRVADLTIVRRDLWVISEARLFGRDAKTMEFSTRLSPVSQYEELKRSTPLLP